jgi:hypothetical protein
MNELPPEVLRDLESCGIPADVVREQRERLKRQCVAIEATGQRPPQRVVCAAMRNRAGKIVCGARHYDKIMHEQIKHARDAWLGCEQGFIDQYGTFLTREEALRIAREQGQIRARCGGDELRLYSENLY